MAILKDTNLFRIEHHPAINRARPFALDFKDRTGGRVCLVNVGWFETESECHRFINQFTESGELSRQGEV